MLTVIANYQARPGTGDEIANILLSHVSATRAEPGCVTFAAYRDDDNPERFVLYEQYRDEDAFQVHRRTPHFASYIEGQVAPLLEERTWHRYSEVAPQSAATNK